MQNMNLFNVNESPNLAKDCSSQDVLDYIVLSIIQRFNQEDLAFKGGYMLNQLMPEVSRMTRDVDFSVDSAEQYEKIKVILKDIGDYLVQNEIICYYKVKDSIAPTQSGGIDFYDSNNSRCLGVDVGWHQIVSGTKWYDLKLGQVHAFSVERMLSDKIHAIFTPKRFRRTKDLYDVYYLLENFDVDYKKFKECIELRGELDLNKNPFREEILEQYLHAWNKLNIVSVVSTREIEKPEFKLVIERLGHFCFPVLNGFKENYSMWEHTKCRWVN